MSAIDGINTIQDNYEKYKDMFTTDNNDVVTMDSFYQLLVAEMQNQDPLEPTSNTEFISQMATFTSLQATQDNFEMQQQNYAKSLVGLVVGVNTGGSELVTGTVEYVTYGDTIKVCVDGTNYNLDSVKLVYGEAETVGNQIGTYGSFATGLIGKEVTVKGTDATGVSVYDSGLVSSVEIQGGMVRVIINGYAYNASDVVSIAEASTEEEEDTDAASTLSAIEQLAQLAESLGTTTTVETAEEEEEEAVTAVEETADADIQDLTDEEETESLYELFS